MHLQIWLVMISTLIEVFCDIELGRLQHYHSVRAQLYSKFTLK